MDHLPQSIKTLINLIESKSEVNNQILKDFAIRCNIKENDLLPFAVYNHPKNESYGRKLLFDGGRFKILVMTWNPGDFSAIHSHGKVDWGLIKYFGEGQQNLYDVEDDLLTLYEIKTMTNGSYEEITANLIHQTGNNSNTPVLTLHIYGSDRAKHNITDGTVVFNLEKMEAHVTKGSAYVHLPNYEIKLSEKCPLPDKDTFIYNGILKLQYYCRQNDISFNRHVSALLSQMTDYYG